MDNLRVVQSTGIINTFVFILFWFCCLATLTGQEYFRFIIRVWRRLGVLIININRCFKLLVFSHSLTKWQMIPSTTNLYLFEPRVRCNEFSEQIANEMYKL